MPLHSCSSSKRLLMWRLLAAAILCSSLRMCSNESATAATIDAPSTAWSPAHLWKVGASSRIGQLIVLAATG